MPWPRNLAVWLRAAVARPPRSPGTAYPAGPSWNLGCRSVCRGHRVPLRGATTARQGVRMSGSEPRNRAGGRGPVPAASTIQYQTRSGAPETETAAPGARLCTTQRAGAGGRGPGPFHPVRPRHPRRGFAHLQGHRRGSRPHGPALWASGQRAFRTVTGFPPARAAPPGRQCAAPRGALSACAARPPVCATAGTWRPQV